MSCHPDEPVPASTAPARPAHPHPLDPLTADEITTARRVLTEAGKVTPATRFPLVLLDEPDRHTAAAHRP
ncbi:tyramine oxidase, partial [Streptomyces sp. UNOB3_S3]|nr:tyramine oxidase [Streptomyces sp. UNOB3_S3]